MSQIEDDADEESEIDVGELPDRFMHTLQLFVRWHAPPAGDFSGARSVPTSFSAASTTAPRRSGSI